MPLEAEKRWYWDPHNLGDKHSPVSELAFCSLRFSCLIFKRFKNIT